MRQQEHPGSGSYDPIDASARRRSAVALIALGSNAWATSVGWTLLPAEVSLRASMFAASALVWLVLGALLHLRRGSAAAENAARWLCLCVYPAALAAALCSSSEAARERIHTPLTMAFCALSLLAYGAIAVLTCRVPIALLPATTQPRPAARNARSPERQTIRALSIALLLAGALAIGLVAPLLPAYSEVEAAWGEAAEAGAVLAAVVAAALSVTIVAIDLGSLLQARAAQRTLSARQRRNRVATLLFLSLFGGVVYLTVMH